MDQKKKKNLIPPHPLTNFEIQKYCINEPRFNDFFSRDNLPIKIKDGAYVINLDEYADTGTRCIVLFCTEIEVIYFYSFGVKHNPEEIKEFIRNKNIKTNIQNTIKQFNHEWIFCIGFIDSFDFMFTGKKLTDFTNLFFPYNLKNDSIILKYFKDE